ncbi:MAG: KOW domain-containing RNA-binding protein [Clostridia bacterium]|nr:KOW domain-containing RNA-binding protein [Clostridia bacterium]
MLSKAFELGQVVLSTQGHDKGKSYVVVKVEDERVLVCDGTYKCIKNPKRKNPNHLKTTAVVDEILNSKLKDGLKINDQMIYHTLLKFKKSNKE